jgi:hypothetical protein
VFGAVFFSLFYIDIWHTPNPISRALPVLTAHEEGSLEITKYEHIGLDKSKIGDRYYSDKAPLPTLLTIPFYELSSAFGIDKWDYSDPRYKKAPRWYLRLSLIIFLGTIICSVLPFCLMLFFAFKWSGHFKYKPTLLILTFFGTYLFVYAGTYFNHILSGAALAFAVYFTQQKDKEILSGLFVSLAFLSEYTLGLFAVILPCYYLVKEKPLKHIGKFMIGLIPAALIYAWYNYSITGNPFTFVFYYTDFETFSKGIKQNYGFGLPSFESIFGLLLSPYMGILFFFPALIFFIDKWRKDKLKELFTSPVFGSSLTMFLLISCYFIWWGGYSWGPRYLIPLACVLAMHSGKIFAQLKYKVLAIGILVTSFIIQFLDKATVLYLIPDRLSKEGEASFPLTDVVLKAVEKGNFNTNNILSWLFNYDAKLSAILFVVLFALWLVGMELLYRKSFKQLN